MEGALGFSKLEEDITCSVCLQDLTDPVSITCGHTFCRACITVYWATAQPQGYLCPECRRTCPKHQLIPAYRLQHLVTRVQLAKAEQAKRESMVSQNVVQAPASAVRLVYTDPGGRLQLDESVVQSCFLDGAIADYPLCLICVIGEKRWGKSTLMNYILRALHSLEKGQPVSLGEPNDPLTGFAWSNGADSLTKGVWICNRPFILERNGDKMAVFVLDTEGSLDIESDLETCIKLSALSMLLSSYLIFNINAFLRTTELEYLEMYLYVAEMTGAAFSLQHPQHLDLLVRDWNDPKNCGREAAVTYIAKEKEKLCRKKEYPRVSKTLNSPSVSGFLLPHPGIKFQTSCDGKLADMNEHFRSNLTGYITELIEELWEHRKADTQRKQITCAKLGSDLKVFFSALNNKHYGFKSPMEMFYALQNEQILNDIRKTFQDLMKKETPPSPVDDPKIETFRMNVSDGIDTLLSEYKDRLEGDESKKQQLQDKLRTEMTQELKNVLHSLDVKKKFQDFIKKEIPSSVFDALKITPSKLKKKVSGKIDTLLSEYRGRLEGDESKKQQLVDELRAEMEQEEKEACAQHRRRYAAGVGVAVGGGVVLGVVGIAGGAVAGVAVAAAAGGVVIAEVATGIAAAAGIGGAVISGGILGAAGSWIRHHVRKCNSEAGAAVGAPEAGATAGAPEAGATAEAPEVGAADTEPLLGQQDSKSDKKSYCTIA